MEKQSQVPTLSPIEAERFWTGGNDARQAATDAQGLTPETLTTLNCAERLHSQCRHCRAAITRDGDGVWRHAGDRVLCDSLQVAKAAPVGIDFPGVGVLTPGSSPVELRPGREGAGGEVGERSPDLVAGADSQAKEAAADEEASTGDGNRPWESEWTELVTALNRLVRESDPESALGGLTKVAIAFRSLLDIYAAPNPDNPEGMSDNAIAFRAHFSRIILGVDEIGQPAGGVR